LLFGAKTGLKRLLKRFLKVFFGKNKKSKWLLIALVFIRESKNMFFVCATHVLYIFHIKKHSIFDSLVFIKHNKNDCFSIFLFLIRLLDENTMLQLSWNKKFFKILNDRIFIFIIIITLYLQLSFWTLKMKKISLKRGTIAFLLYLHLEIGRHFEILNLIFVLFRWKLCFYRFYLDFGRYIDFLRLDNTIFFSSK
jgi:hypothetical protein